MLTSQQLTSIPNLTYATQQVYQTLIGVATTQPGIDTIAAKSGYCRRTVQRAIRELEEQHLLRIKRRHDKQGRTLVNQFYLLKI